MIGIELWLLFNSDFLTLFYLLRPSSLFFLHQGTQEVNPDDNSEYADISDAAGKLVTVQVPVTFADNVQGNPATVLSFYNDETLLDANQGVVSANDEYIEYEVEIPSNTTEIMVMCWETMGHMVPVCEATER